MDGPKWIDKLQNNLLVTDQNRIWAINHQYTRESWFVGKYLRKYKWNDFKRKYRTSEDE